MPSFNHNKQTKDIPTAIYLTNQNDSLADPSGANQSELRNSSTHNIVTLGINSFLIILTYVLFFAAVPTMATGGKMSQVIIHLCSLSVTVALSCTHPHLT